MTKICIHTGDMERNSIMLHQDDERKIQEKTFWMDHTSNAHSLRAVALQGQDLCSNHIRPDCNVKHFSVYLSEWQESKRQGCCMFIYLSISKQVIVCFSKNEKSFISGKTERKKYILVCYYPLTRKMHQSAWLRIIGCSNLSSKILDWYVWEHIGMTQTAPPNR